MRPLGSSLSVFGSRCGVLGWVLWSRRDEDNAAHVLMKVLPSFPPGQFVLPLEGLECWAMKFFILFDREDYIFQLTLEHKFELHRSTYM